MMSHPQWLETEDGKYFRELKAECKHYYEQKGGRKAREKEKLIEAALAPPVNDLVMGVDPKASKADREKAKAKEAKLQKACANYPTKEELLEHFGVRWWS